MQASNVVVGGIYKVKVSGRVVSVVIKDIVREVKKIKGKLKTKTYYFGINRETNRYVRVTPRRIRGVIGSRPPAPSVKVPKASRRKKPSVKNIIATVRAKQRKARTRRGRAKPSRNPVPASSPAPRRLPTMKWRGKTWFFDVRLQELRNVKAPWDRIPFSMWESAPDWEEPVLRTQKRPKPTKKGMKRRR